MDDLFDMALPDNGVGTLFTKLSSIHGLGLFTTKDIPSNTILCRRLGLRTGLSPRDKRAMVGVDGLDPPVAEDSIFKRINHSCHPNACLTDTGCLISIKQLYDQAEITIDYSTLLSGSPWHIPCSCGDLKCRKIIRSWSDEI